MSIPVGIIKVGDWEIRVTQCTSKNIDCAIWGPRRKIKMSCYTYRYFVRKSSWESAESFFRRFQNDTLSYIEGQQGAYTRKRDARREDSQILRLLHQAVGSRWEPGFYL